MRASRRRRRRPSRGRHDVAAVSAAVWSRDPMTSSREDGALPRLKPRDEIDELFGRANPNPDRIGCPPREVLIALARRERPIGDPAYEHLIKCSPCYLEVRGFQEAAKAERRRRLLKTTVWATAAAAVLLIAVTTGRMFLFGNDQTATRGAGFRTEFDLRPYALTRGVQQRSELPPLSLPHGHGTVLMRLPTGSEPGKYEVQVLDSTLVAIASATGDADVRDRITTLEVTLNLGPLSPGNYQLAIRRNGQPWQMFPAQAP
jgi:hypothetical protein